MKAIKTGLGLTATIAVLALPAAAQAEYLIPPSNSAATQYTEAVPTAGGPKATNNSHHGKSGKAPKQVLGHKNVAKLDAQGPEGRAAAEVVAETAPTTVASTSSSSAGAQAASPGNAAVHELTPEGNSAESGSQSSHGTGQSSGNPSSGNASADQKATLASQQLPSGSSGLGEVLSQATGSSDSGSLGLLLPLIVLGVIAWSVAFVLRRRGRPTH
jgi:hypothetical protein